MINKKTKKVLKEVEVVEHEYVTCDVCGKDMIYEDLGFTKVAYYYHIMKGHHDWGNDSIESIKHIDACCDECLSRASAEWLKESKGSYTAYFEVEKERHFLKLENEDEE